MSGLQKSALAMARSPSLIIELIGSGGHYIGMERSAQSLKGMPFTRFGFHIRSLEEITEKLKASGFRKVDSKYFDEGTSKLGDLKIPVDSLIIRR